MINKKEKSAHGAATPLGTQLNRQEQYSTDRQKSEIRKLMGLLEESGKEQ